MQSFSAKTSQRDLPLIVIWFFFANFAEKCHSQMKLIYRLLRTIAVTAIILVAVVPAVLYVALSLTGVQRRIADTLETELSALLDARVTIGDLGVMPFNRVILRDVTVETAPGDTALTVRRLGNSFPSITTFIGS